MFNKQKEEKVLETILEGTKCKGDTHTISHEEADALTAEIIKEKGKSFRRGYCVGFGVAVAAYYVGTKIGK